jgi:hypothetical protein
MKMVITEKQLLNLRKKTAEIKEDSVTPSLAPISPGPAGPLQYNKSEFFKSAPRTVKYDVAGAPSAEDYPAYPETGKWESGVTRGPGNQIGVTKWEDVVGSTLTRGKANPLK